MYFVRVVGFCPIWLKLYPCLASSRLNHYSCLYSCSFLFRRLDIHTYHLRVISVGVASQIFLQDPDVQNYLAVSNTAEVTNGKPIAVWSQSISSVSAINPLVAFYDIHGRKTEVLFFYFVSDTARASRHDKSWKSIIPLSWVKSKRSRSSHVRNTCTPEFMPY
jgi:hypothetical protein